MPPPADERPEGASDGAPGGAGDGAAPEADRARRGARLAAAGVVAVVGLAVVGAAVLALTERAPHAVPAAAEASTSTTATTLPPATAAPTTEPEPEEPEPVDARPLGLQRGASGPEVEWLQQRLHDLRFDPGPVDGRFGMGTLQAVWAFQKIHGFPVSEVVSPEVRAALEAPGPIAPLVPDGGARRVEVDLARQVLFLYDGGELRLISHVSTGHGGTYCAPGGCGRAVTPIGSHRFMWRVSGWRTSRLGQLYNPVYFTGSGVAVHGATSVPAHPASAGCVRIPMHIAEYFPRLVQRGDPVYVTDGRPVPPLPPLDAPPDPGPPPDDGPGPDDTTGPDPGAPSEGGDPGRGDGGGVGGDETTSTTGPDGAAGPPGDGSGDGHEGTAGGATSTSAAAPRGDRSAGDP